MPNRTRCALPPRPLRLPKAPASRMRRRAPTDRTNCCRGSSSSAVPFCRQSFAELMQSGPDSRFYCSERLIQPLGDAGIRQFGEERRLDCLSLVGRENLQRGANRLALLLKRDQVLRISGGRRRHVIGRFGGNTLLALLEP